LQYIGLGRYEYNNSEQTVGQDSKATQDALITETWVELRNLYEEIWSSFQYKLFRCASLTGISRTVPPSLRNRSVARNGDCSENNEIDHVNYDWNSSAYIF